MGNNRKYTLNVFTRILLGLLAVFYVSVFAIEAAHSHDNLVETTSSSDNPENGPGVDDCLICAYFGHHEIKEIAVGAIPSFAFVEFLDCLFNPLELKKTYQTHLQDFVNRGPPCDLI